MRAISDLLYNQKDRFMTPHICVVIGQYPFYIYASDPLIATRAALSNA